MYSKKLNKNYTVKNGNFVFDDGVIYNRNEIHILNLYPDIDLPVIHKVKKMFNGEIVKSKYRRTE